MHSERHEIFRPRSQLGRMMIPVLTTGNEQSGREGQASKQDLCNAFPAN
jgi:hypothetical protein